MLTDSTIAKGRYAESAVRKKIESLGFPYILRSYASHGPIDLLCSNGSGEMWAVQVKSAKHGSYLSPKELEKLVDWSKKFNAKPVFAFKRKSRWILKHLVSEESIRAVSKEAVKESDDGIYQQLLQELMEERMNKNDGYGF